MSIIAGYTCTNIGCPKELNLDYKSEKTKQGKLSVRFRPEFKLYFLPYAHILRYSAQHPSNYTTQQALDGNKHTIENTPIHSSASYRKL